MLALFVFSACENNLSNESFEDSLEVFAELEAIDEASSVNATVNRGGNDSPAEGYRVGDDSFFRIKLENIEKNDIINNGTVGAYCLEWKKPMRDSNSLHTGTKIYSTKNASKWEPINYLFALRNELKAEDPTLSFREFQAALWSLAGQMDLAPEFDLTKLSDEELPRRMFVNGELKLQKDKVIQLVERVNKEYTANPEVINGYGGVTVLQTASSDQNGVIPDPPPVIEETTNIYIYFDASGSMNSTLSPLQTMRSTLLKDALLPFFNDDGDLYDERVQIVSPFDERFLDWYNLGPVTPPSEGNIVALVFQDEAQSVYHGIPFSGIPTSAWNSDMSALRTTLDGYIADPNKGSNFFRGVMFQVENPFVGTAFQDLVKATQDGTGNYSGTNGLSDRNEFNYVYDVVDGDTPATYLNLVETALEDLGFDLTP